MSDQKSSKNFGTPNVDERERILSEGFSTSVTSVGVTDQIRRRLTLNETVSLNSFFRCPPYMGTPTLPKFYTGI